MKVKKTLHGLFFLVIVMAITRVLLHFTLLDELLVLYFYLAVLFRWPGELSLASGGVLLLLTTFSPDRVLSFDIERLHIYQWTLIGAGLLLMLRGHGLEYYVRYLGRSAQSLAPRSHAVFSSMSFAVKIKLILLAIAVVGLFSVWHVSLYNLVLSSILFIMILFQVDDRFLVAGSLVALVAAPLFLAMGWDARAETIAVYGYYLLGIIVLGRIARAVKENRSTAAKQ